MSLMSTLAKVAISVAVAKGMKKVMAGGQSRQTQSQTGGLGSILGGLAKGNTGGGLGGLLGGLAGGSNSGSSLDGMLGSVLGGKQGQANGGLGGLLDSLGSNQQGGFGDRINQSIENFGENSNSQSSADDEQSAKVLLAVMIQAAKADGEIDAEEKAAITKNLGSISEDDMEFINQQLKAPLNPEGLAKAVPSGMEQQAYAMALLAIDLDNKNEAEFLHTLASNMNLEPQLVNSIHSQMGETTLYS